MGLINYLGNSKVIKRICQLLKVTDVQDGEGHSLVDENGIAIVSGGGSSTLADLTDVDVTGASDGDVLALNGTSGKWEDKKLPTKLSDFTNDTGFITNTVNNLTNYYKKSETYTQAEVNALISAIVTIDIEVVQTLPTTDISTTTIYLLPKQTAGTDDVYDEYINTTGTSAGWELIGSTQVDLSNYYTKSEVDALIPDDLADLNDDSTHRLVTDTEKTAWSAKVDDNPTFSEASTRANIDSGDSFATILGKIKKFFTDLKTVAFTGSYNDLSNQPTIPSVSANPSTTTATLSGLEIDGVGYDIPSGGGNVQSDWNETDSTADDYIKNKPSLATVATSGSYNDLSNKPTIPDISTKVSKSGDTMTGRLNFSNVNTAEMNFRTGHNNYDGVVSYQTAGNEAWLFTTKNGVTSIMFVNGEDTITNASDRRWQSLVPGLQIKNNKVAIGKLIPDGTTPTYALDVNGDVNATTFDGNLKYTHTNEVNFGGGNQSTCYFNYRNADTEQAAAVSSIAYKFCNYSNDTSKSNILAGYFNGYTIEKSVPSNAVFTDTNNAVTQTNTGSESYAYRLLYSATADSTTRTEGARKGNLTFTPSSGVISFYHNSNGRVGTLSPTSLKLRNTTEGAEIYCDGQQQLYMCASHETNYYLFLGVADSTWTLCPNGKDYLRLGTSNHRWNQIYSNSTSISTSDRKEKKDIKPLDEFARELIMSLNPVSFKFKNGESGRTHYGMIAQDVEDSLEELGITPMDIAAFCKDQKTVQVKETVNKQIKFKDVKVKGEYVYGLRYEEFIAPLIKTVQLQQEEINLLKQRIDILEGK